MSELKPFVILQESKFMVIDEDSKATYADQFVTGYVQMLKNGGPSNNFHRQIHLLLFIGPDCFYNYLFEIIGKDNLKIHDYFTPNINDLSVNYELNLDTILTDDNIIGNQSIVIVNCLSSLILTVGLAKAIRFVEKLASRVGQLICLFNRDICVEKFPNIETLGATYIQLNSYKSTVMNNNIAYEIAMTHRKKGGGIWKKALNATQNLDTYEIKFEKAPINIPKLKISTSESTLKPQATFRTEMNARELEQRNKTPLPYTLSSNLPNESKIHYVPDDVDDFDEEDPDDDLPF
ncbi:hypothetical protein PV325_013515 [Microctonus aethiopoides]|uniref:Elongator complex protein 5 n=1 Tax=Microctonus aethiopoides TaxID=144406 RepID=A0AA39FJH5_9HYME|nr:hypothetical protein PV325_013515 [Microctonus aethiopoides]KAK0094884.1 hypothetical protein PV326_009681 [Microctonus aethiopoides]KAK0170747.1 hypothetical protein PV328_008553 [Microctonus aethiopoides]